ncbi:MAG: T9SS C-terminal target domain-containing protein [Saprospirales bacterium]|nr:MAG: T9SS C-terminal target domain-containing protein [Saprospirales bacterium]
MPMQAQDCIDIEQIKTDLSNIVDKCSCDDPLVIGVPNQTTFISTYQLGGLVQNRCIKVHGTVIIDEWKTFVVCDIIMGPGSKMETQGPQFLGIVNSNLHSCGDYLWDGIKLNTGSRLSLRGSIFQHSLNGIYSDGGLLIRIAMTNNVFNNNHYAVKLDDPFLPIRRTEVLLSGNIFSHSEELKLHWESPFGRPNFTSGVKTNFAIVNSLVGNDPCNRANIFIGLIYGYYLKNTIARIHADLFHDFNFNNSVFFSKGIKTEGYLERIGESSLELRGWPTNDIESFNGLDFGVYSTLGYSDIEGVIIDNASAGIRLTDPLRNFSIKNNYIRIQRWSGISVIPMSSSNGSILNNIIDVVADEDVSRFSGGIWISAFRPHSGYSTVIRDNEINLNSGTFGIKSEGFYSVGNKISCNVINILKLHEKTNLVSGIEILGGQRNSIVENEIFGQYLTIPNVEVSGLKIIESPSNYLRDNSFSNTQIGLHFSNWNSNTFQDGNVFSNHDVGYYVGETGVTGDQWFSANKWLGSYGIWAAQNEGDADLSRYLDYQNLVTTTCWPGSISPDPGWFEPVQGIGFCSDHDIFDCIVEGDFEVTVLTYLDTLVARGELEFDDFESRRTWQAERYLLRNLIDFPDLIGSSGSLMDSFLNDALSTSLWDYHELRVAIEDYSTIPDSISDLWHAYYDVYLELNDDAELAIDQWLDYPDSLELTEVISEIYEQIDSIWTLSSTMYQNWREESVDNLANLLPSITSLSTPNLYATSEKLILRAIVRTAQGLDSISASMRNSLIQLSESCMLEYGPSVIDARGIVSLFDYKPDAIMLNCIESEGFRLINLSESEVTLFEIFPNPSTGYFNLEFSSPVEKGGDVKLYDPTGKLVHTERIKSSISLMEISVDHLPIGQYTIKVNLNGKKEARSLIISR